MEIREGTVEQIDGDGTHLIRMKDGSVQAIKKNDPNAHILKCEPGGEIIEDTVPEKDDERIYLCPFSVLGEGTLCHNGFPLKDMEIGYNGPRDYLNAQDPIRCRAWKPDQGCVLLLKPLYHIDFKR